MTEGLRRIGGIWRSLWLEEDGRLAFIDQTRLPHVLEVLHATTLEEVATAIRSMQIRGAPLIGVIAAYGVWFAVRRDPGDAALEDACQVLCRTRPTAVNLRRRVEQVRDLLRTVPPEQRAERARALAVSLNEEEVELCRRIGEHGLELIRAARRPGQRVQVLTHCNAGWLATGGWGTALAPIYRAHDAGIPIHVWVDETRPRNQGYLTAWELTQHGVPCTVIADNAGGHLMQQGRVDLCIVGTDRTTATGDVANKVGTYLKAVAAHDNRVPFYVALPESSIDWALRDGRQIPIEERDERELHEVIGRSQTGVGTVRVSPPSVAALNIGFDVTPARLVTGLITERGVCGASEAELRRLYPEAAKQGGT